jgi:hypothetical protein
MQMTNSITVPKHIAEAIVSPRAHAERDALFSGLRWLRVNNPVGLVEADGYDPFWLLTRHQDVYEVSRQNSRFHNGDRPVVLVNREGEAAMRAKTGKPYLNRTLVVDCIVSKAKCCQLFRVVYIFAQIGTAPFVRVQNRRPVRQFHPTAQHYGPARR